MTNIKYELDQALVQLRATNASMIRTLAELDAVGVWSGDDAAAFATKWQEQVQRNLDVAVGALESITLAPAG